MRPTYNLANLLEAVSVNLRGAAVATSFVGNIDYNAKGQRVLIQYGDQGAPSAATAYNYDPLTFRLATLTTTRPGFPAAQQPAQALTYTYDPTGNITHIADGAQQTIYFKNQIVLPDGDYTYDAIYRLTLANGREQLGQSGGHTSPPWPTSYNDVPRIHLPHPGDGNAMGTYSEQYQYDNAGNFLKLIHRGLNPANPGWTRSYTYNEASLLEPGKVSNRLTSTSVGGSALWNEPYTYDLHGNTTSMPQLQSMQWDFKDQMLMTQRQAVNPQDGDGILHQGERTYYVYNAAGERVRKTTESAQGVKTKERFYLGSVEVYREYGSAGNTKLERQTLHIMDDKQRIALVETSDGGTSAIRFQFSNHLGTACLELDETGAVITYEEYYPYGSTSYQAGRSVVEVSLKRYRYASKERDEETGFCYFGARYYAVWIGRWMTPDPIGLKGGPNLYAYCKNNPITRHDPQGTTDDTTTGAGITIDTSGGVKLGPITIDRSKYVVGFGIGDLDYMGTAEKNTGLTAINIQDQITLGRSLHLGRGVPQGFPFFPSGPAAERDFAAPEHPSGLSPMFSGVITQEVLEGKVAGTAHFNMSGVDLTPPLPEKDHPGFSSKDFHSSSEARQGIAHLASTDPGERKVDIVIEHEEGVSTIPKGSNTVQGLPLPARLANRVPNISNRPTPPSKPGPPDSGGSSSGGAAPGGSGRLASAFSSAATGALGTLGRAIPGVAELEAGLVSLAFAAARYAATAPLFTPLLGAAEAVPGAAGVGGVGAGAGHLVRAGLEAAGVGKGTATTVGFGTAVLTGAGLGLFIPVVGPAIGAGIGALVAGALYLWSL